MHETIQEKVSVLTLFQRPQSRHRPGELPNSQAVPLKVRWQGRVYKINKLGLHHTQRAGRILHHIFSVTDGNTFFRLNFNTETLDWILEEISDGLTN